MVDVLARPMASSQHVERIQLAFDTLPDESDVDEPVLTDEPPPTQEVPLPGTSSEDRNETSGNSRNSVWCAPSCFPGPRGI